MFRIGDSWHGRGDPSPYQGGVVGKEKFKDLVGRGGLRGGCCGKANEEECRIFASFFLFLRVVILLELRI